MKLNLISLFLLASLAIFTASCKTGFNGKSVINEGSGFGNYQLKNLKTGKVKRDLGNDYELISHNNYSEELLYKNEGVSFYYLLSKPTDIFSITFNSNYKSKTGKGFVMGEMNVSDMIQIYETPSWDRPEDILYARYDSLGIYFKILPVDKEPEEYQLYSFDDSAVLKKIDLYYKTIYKNEKIAEISIGLPNSNF